MMAACHEPGNTRSVQAAAVVDTEQLDFGEVPVGEWREQRVLIRNVGYVPFPALEALELATTPRTGGAGRGRPGGAGRVQGGEGALPPAARGGDQRDGARGHGRQHRPREHRARARARARRRPSRCRPPVLDFETLEVDSDRTLTLTVTNPVDLPLTVKVAGDGADRSRRTPSPFRPSARSRCTPSTCLGRWGSMGALVEVRSCEGCTPTTAELAGNSVASAFVFEPDAGALRLHPRARAAPRATRRVRNITWRPVTISS